MRTSDYALCFSIAAGMVGVALPSAAPAQTGTIGVEAGPIWSQSDAEKKCPQIAKTNGGVWTGEWKTTVPGRMSVCELRLPSRPQDVVVAVEVGPIWNRADADTKCREVAKAKGGAWNGQWRTTVPRKMSVCELRLPLPKG
jgi:hypothetical protein